MKKYISPHPNSKPISKNIYITEKKRGCPIFIVRSNQYQKENIRHFDNLQEAIRYRD